MPHGILAPLLAPPLEMLLEVIRKNYTLWVKRILNNPVFHYIFIKLYVHKALLDIYYSNFNQAREHLQIFSSYLNLFTWGTPIPSHIKVVFQVLFL